jgi:transposase
LKKVAREVGLDLRGASLNLDGGFDSARNRQGIFHAGLIPNIPEHPRNRKRPKRGRTRLFNAALQALRQRVERTFAWEDKFQRVLLRFERLQQRHYGMKLMAYTLINLRAFCSTSNPQPVNKERSHENTTQSRTQELFFRLTNSKKGIFAQRLEIGD